MDIGNQGVGFVEKFLYYYYKEWNPEKITDMMDCEILWFETGIDTFYSGQDAVLKLAEEKRTANFHSYEITEPLYKTKRLGRDYCLVLLKARLKEKSADKLCKSHEILITAICRLTDTEEKLCYFHVSAPAADIEARNLELLMLTNNVPGAIFCCKYDERLTLTQMSESFLEMFGYTQKEIEEKFANSFWEMIDARDREATLEDVKKQLALSDTKEIEYRIRKKDGSVAWILDKGRLITASDGSGIFYCVLVDITKGRLAQEELAMSLERHQIIMDQTNDIVFEWDIERDSLSFSANWEKKFHYEPVKERFFASLSYNSHVFREDLPAFRNAFDQIRRGKGYMEIEARVKKTKEEYIWCRFRLTSQLNKDGIPIKAVGVIIDIDNEKKNSQQLLEKAERDPLTKLYNKGTAHALIDNYLQSSNMGKQSALMIIDIDDFKMVNDTLGHLFGDAFLVEITSDVRKLFRESDIVGRIGGDEFIAFIKDIPGNALVFEKARQVVEAFRNLPMQESWDKSISCSIGISVFPNDGQHFQELYKKADYALYQAKKQGKNQYVHYDDSIGDGFPGIPVSMPTAVNEKIDSNEGMGNTLNSKLVEYIFKILYKSIDVEAAVSAILEIVGHQFNVSRAYIFENTEDDRYCSNTFEWCNTGVKEEIDNLKHVSYDFDLGGNYVANFNEDGIFYCRDIMELPRKQKAILEPQGIKSMLQCAITDNGEFKGYVGFDECRMNRFWTQEQITTLIFTSEILSTFLLKKRAQDSVVQTLEGMQNILDNQNSWIYVIGAESYEMYYINQKTKSLVPDVREGMCCYRKFFDREEPCENCPVKDLDDTVKNCTKEFYNPILNVWSSADASRIRWKGKDAVLLCCHDITKYKIN
ncbi:diguanylate cyclase domain-containing protein [Robinsoniella peoriensis]|uniref:Putative diguanylate cyclase AdrA n=1 Tax=Robinsoniella peoriensis TaxID=180332 RepID=A0A4V6HRG8_9FIRM|nr:diguanylate cyclase [Robinsoniella peoriensis]MDU7028808.1 diguanylate cyclase [Clostridiales bacterium]TLC99037.1 putative diguanylate cyclase AdrA [Robinsoniella peoriensis]